MENPCGGAMQFIFIAFICIGAAILAARRHASFGKAARMLLLVAPAIGLLDGLGFMYVEFHNSHGDYFNPHTGALDTALAFKMFALAVLPAAVLSFVLALFAWLVFRPIFGRKPDA
jgi:hypothetical protein